MSRRRLSPSARICLGFALFFCLLSVGQTLILFSSMRHFRGSFESRLSAMESRPVSVSTNIVQSVAAVSSSATNAPPRFIGAGYARGTRLLFPYADIETDGEVNRYYLDPLPVSATNIARYIVANIKNELPSRLKPPKQ